MAHFRSHRPAAMEIAPNAPPIMSGESTANMVSDQYDAAGPQGNRSMKLGRTVSDPHAALQLSGSHKMLEVVVDLSSESVSIASITPTSIGPVAAGSRDPAAATREAARMKTRSRSAHHERDHSQQEGFSWTKTSHSFRDSLRRSASSVFRQLFSSAAPPNEVVDPAATQTSSTSSSLLPGNGGSSQRMSRNLPQIHQFPLATIHSAGPSTEVFAADENLQQFISNRSASGVPIAVSTDDDQGAELPRSASKHALQGLQLISKVTATADQKHLWAGVEKRFHQLADANSMLPKSSFAECIGGQFNHFLIIILTKEDGLNPSVFSLGELVCHLPVLSACFITPQFASLKCIEVFI
jgi:hypothetical protein